MVGCTLSAGNSASIGGDLSVANTVQTGNDLSISSDAHMGFKLSAAGQLMAQGLSTAGESIFGKSVSVDGITQTSAGCSTDGFAVFGSSMSATLNILSRSLSASQDVEVGTLSSSGPAQIGTDIFLFGSQNVARDFSVVNRGFYGGVASICDFVYSGSSVVVDGRIAVGKDFCGYAKCNNT